MSNCIYGNDDCPICPSEDHGSQPQEAVPTEGHDAAVRAIVRHAEALIADVRSRYPGERLRCPHMRGIAEGLDDLGRSECGVCGGLIASGDDSAQDVELGTCHAKCLEGSFVIDLGTFSPPNNPNNPGEA